MKATHVEGKQGGRNHDLKEMVDVPEVQSLMNSLYRLTKMPSVIRDENGHVLATAGSWEMCDVFHRKHPGAVKHCHENIACLSRGIAQGSFKLLKCKNNLCAMATPIFANGRLAGNVYCGHFFLTHEQPDEKVFLTQARRYGFDETRYIDAMRRIPVFDKDVIADIVAGYALVGNTMAAKGNASHMLQQRLDEQRAVLATVEERDRELLRTNRNLKKALQELRVAQLSLIDQERHHALSTMASGIAHDFNNSLAVIQGYSDLLLNNQAILDDGETTRSYIGNIHQAACKAAATVRCLRKFYQPRNIGAQQQMDLNRVIDEALTMSRPRWRSQARAQDAEIKVVRKLDEIPPISGNEAELHELMSNLIFNAVDAMPAGGTLSVKTFHDDEHVYMHVSDTGIGMSDDVRDHCLNPFFTTRKETGSGLGLSVAQGVVKRHNGEMLIDSAPNHGTTFEIRFPLLRGDDSSVSGDTESREAAETRPLRILVVEDDAVQATLLQQILKAENHTVDIAVDGSDGLAQAVAKTYDLVITDQSMPGISGSELARKLRRVRPEQRILLLTGFGDIMHAAAEDDDECVDKVLSKPYQSEDLRREIRRLTR